MIQPFGNRLLVRRLPTPETTESGLFIPYSESPSAAVVLAVGPGRRSKGGEHIPITDIAVDDRVMFNWRDAYLDTREVGPEMFIVDYEVCQAGMREVDGKMQIWPLHGWIFVSRSHHSESHTRDIDREVLPPESTSCT